MSTPPPAATNNYLRSRIAAFIGLAPGAMLSADSDSHQGPRRKFSGNQMIVGLVAHVLQFQGCFAFHMKQFFGMDASPSALSQRRTAMGSEPFRAILRVALRPLARAAEHSGCFFKGLRLTGIDGTQWSLSNTLQSHTVATAEQEIAALLVAASLLAEERLEIARCAGGEIVDAGAVRISFGLCYHYITALYMVQAASDGLLSGAAQTELIERVRKVRQPVSKWPRMIEPESVSSPILCEILIIA